MHQHHRLDGKHQPLRSQKTKAVDSEMGNCSCLKHTAYSQPMSSAGKEKSKMFKEQNLSVSGKVGKKANSLKLDILIPKNL